MDFFGGRAADELAGGERPGGLRQRAGAAFNKNFRFTITTNGVLLNDEIMDFVNKEMSNVVISVDGRKEVNDRMRPYQKRKGKL